MIVVHGLKNCDTCRKAVRWLDTTGQAARLRDFRSEPPATAEIETWLAAIGSDKLVNRRSTTWRTLPETDREQAPVHLLEQHPTLIKRPVIEAEGKLYCGFDEAVCRSLSDLGT